MNFKPHPTPVLLPTNMKETNMDSSSQSLWNTSQLRKVKKTHQHRSKKTECWFVNKKNTKRTQSCMKLSSIKKFDRQKADTFFSLRKLTSKCINPQKKTLPPPAKDCLTLENKVIKRRWKIRIHWTRRGWIRKRRQLSEIKISILTKLGIHINISLERDISCSRNKRSETRSCFWWIIKSMLKGWKRGLNFWRKFIKNKGGA